jgi:mandelate racemase
MPDLIKIGGITGWLRAMALAEAASLPLSSHLLIEASAHALAVSPTCHFLEHLDMAGAVMAEPAPLAGGMITARGPGLGMAWNEDAIKRFEVA